MQSNLGGKGVMAIYFRQVVNDVVCGPWYLLKGWDGLQNLEGLKDWMEGQVLKGEGWDFCQLSVGSWDGRFMNYGKFMQFKVEAREGVLEVDVGEEV